MISGQNYIICTCQKIHFQNKIMRLQFSPDSTYWWVLAPSSAPPILAIKYFYREQFGINLQKKLFWYFSKSTSLRRRWSTSGTRSWRSTAWRRSPGRRCSRRCRGSGSWRTRPSTTSLSRYLTDSMGDLDLICW